MNKQVRILPGTPDDANREYLPERIKTTDIVVNENGNNSIVYPEHLQEFHGVVADGLEDEWYEYVPESYDPIKTGSTCNRTSWWFDDRMGACYLYLMDACG